MRLKKSFEQLLENFIFGYFTIFPYCACDILNINVSHRLAYLSIGIIHKSLLSYIADLSVAFI